jgi:pyruvate/2-oxoglutarate dehydrogenase complex dihydrolipoamide dehydrogenase (E3) component
VSRVVIIGGGPAGYEAALVAAQLGARVTLVERDGLGGACVLTDCVPSKTLVASADSAVELATAGRLGLSLPQPLPAVDLAAVNERVRALAAAQSADIGTRLAAEGVDVVVGSGALSGPSAVRIAGGADLPADVVLLATGAAPRTLPGAEPDGDRVLTWRQLYDLPHLPERLVVVGSGVTGVEFANAYQALGSDVVLVSSRDRVLPGEDADAAGVLEAVFERAGMTILSRSRAAAVHRSASGVDVELTDGRHVAGTHVLIAVGSLPCTGRLGLDDATVRQTATGHVDVDRVSRTNIPGVYAAGDCTGVLPLASVAAMQGRIAMWHALGEAVTPLRLSTVAATVFTMPEIATVGVAEGRCVQLPLETNARAKMQDIHDGFVKLFCRPGAGTVLGGVVVAPAASELILPVSIAVQHALTVDQLAYSFAVYPSLAGSITEAARRLMG